MPTTGVVIAGISASARVLPAGESADTGGTKKRKTGKTAHLVMNGSFGDWVDALRTRGSAIPGAQVAAPGERL
jgi:hypothetical protein